MRRYPALLVVVMSLTFTSSAGALVDHWGEYVSAQPTPAVVSGLENVVKVDSSNSFGIALESDGTVWTFGHGSDGELGDGKRASVETAVKVKFPAGVKIVAIGEAENAGLAVDSTGQGWAWGASTNDTFCTDGSSQVPEEVPGITDAAAVQGGAHHVLWLMANGTVKGCGENKDGQLGLPKSTKEVRTPTEVPGLSNIVEVSAGDLSSCARSNVGGLFCFGLNNHGQVGIGREDPVYAATKVKLPGAVSEVSCGGDRSKNGSTLVMVEGVPYGFGTDDQGQLGDGGVTDKYTPVVSSDLTTLGVTQVIAAGDASAALSEDGDVYTFGSGRGFTLGNGSEGSSTFPIPVDSGKVEVSGTAHNMLDR